jgi:DedD protein
MISLSSFFKNKSPEPAQTKIEPGFRSRQSKVELEKEDTLMENPEVQRARHRLIGAGFLLLIAVIGLPKLFDAQPKKINNDVVVKVVQSVTNTPNSGAQLEEEKLISKNANNLNSRINPDKQAQIDPANEKISSQKKFSEDKPDISTAVPVQEKVKSSAENNESLKTAPKKGSMQTDPGEVIVSSPSLVPKADIKSAKFIVQVAALSSNDRVKNLTAKIKELKINSYVVEKKKEASDVAVIYLVRAGPFGSKEEALSAEKKIAALGMGLSPTIVEINK